MTTKLTPKQLSALKLAAGKFGVWNKHRDNRFESPVAPLIVLRALEKMGFVDALNMGDTQWTVQYFATDAGVAYLKSLALASTPPTSAPKGDELRDLYCPFCEEVHPHKRAWSLAENWICSSCGTQHAGTDRPAQAPTTLIDAINSLATDHPIDLDHSEVITNCPDCGEFLWDSLASDYMKICPACGWPADAAPTNEPLTAMLTPAVRNFKIKAAQSKLERLYLKNYELLAEVGRNTTEIEKLKAEIAALETGSEAK